MLPTPGTVERAPAPTPAALHLAHAAGELVRMCLLHEENGQVNAIGAQSKAFT
jgi:hypothetical protein